MARKKIWTEETDRILIESFQNATAKEIAREIGCAVSTVNKRARKLGLKKDNPHGRNHDARAFILMEYDNLTYNEMAKRTGLKKNTVTVIAKELGLRRTLEKRKANISRARKELYKAERRRINWGLEQKTCLKVVNNRQRQNLRGKLRQCGYIVVKGDNVIYFTDDLVRRPVREANGERLGLKFMPLPKEDTEETQELAASLVPSASGTDNYQLLHNN